MLNQYIATIFFLFYEGQLRWGSSTTLFFKYRANEVINFQYVQSEMEKRKNSIAPVPQANAIKWDLHE